MLMIAKTRIPRSGGAILSGQEFEASETRAAHYMQIGWAAPAPAPTTVAEPEPLKIGDMVNVEIDGVLQFPQPVELLEVFKHEKKSWARVSGSDSAVLFDQVVRTDR
jgi:hypothetical protein